LKRATIAGFGASPLASARAGVLALPPYDDVIGIPAITKAAAVTTAMKERMVLIPKPSRTLLDKITLEYEGEWSMILAGIT
jgi:hypothetical protein